VATAAEERLKRLSSVYCVKAFTRIGTSAYVNVRCICCCMLIAEPGNGQYSLRVPLSGHKPQTWAKWRLLGFDSHEIAAIRDRIWASSASHQPTIGADHEDINERAALCFAKEGAQDQGQARPREVGHSQGARARGSNGAAICGAAFNDAPNAPSHRVAETTLG
jgi:hypothetical protein